MIERQTEDILRQIASSSEYSLHELRAIRQTKTRPHKWYGNWWYRCRIFEEVIDRDEDIERMEE